MKRILTALVIGLSLMMGTVSGALAQENVSPYEQCLKDFGPINNTSVYACSSMSAEDLKTKISNIIKDMNKTELRDDIQKLVESHKHWMEYMELMCDLQGRYIGSPMYKVCPMNELETMLSNLEYLQSNLSMMSEFDLGVMYFDGKDAPQDYVLAYMWFNIAADYGSDTGAKTKADAAAMMVEVASQMTPSQIAKAQALARECVRKNYKGCLAAPEMIATQKGNTESANQTGIEKNALSMMSNLDLGLMYFDGKDVARDYVLAYMWLSIAAENGDKYGAEMRDNVAQDMTPYQIAKAQALARECAQKQYKGC